jgi:hypothetical protein
MYDRLNGWHAAAVVGFVLWLGAVLWRYQAVSSPRSMFAVLLPVVVVILLALAALGAGLPVWRWAAADSPATADDLVVALATGAGALAACTAAASLVGELRPQVMAAIVALAIVAGGLQVVRLAPRCRVRMPVGALVPAGIIVLAVAITLPATVVLAPFYDQFNYHLAFPFQWLRAGHIFVFPRHSYSFFPSNMGLLYVYPLATVGAWGGQVVHWCMGALAVLGAARLARSLAGPHAGWWAAAILAATPAVLTPATWAGADLGVAAFAGAAWLAALRAPRHGSRVHPLRWWLLCGALAGLAAGCKYLALAMVAVPVFLVVAFLRPEHSRQERVRKAGLWLAGAALAFAPWMVRNLVVSGNPLFPFFSSLLPPRVLLRSQGTVEVTKAARVAEFPAARLAPHDRLTLGTFRPQGEAGSIGPVYLGMVPLAVWLAVRSRRRGACILLAGVVLGVAGWWWAPQLGRYLVPVLLLLAALLGAAWAHLLKVCPSATRGWLVTLLAGALIWNATSVLGDSLERINCLTGQASFEDLMRSKVTYWPAISFINEKLPPNARLLLVAESRTLFLERDVIVDDPFRTPFIVEVANSEASADAMLRLLHAKGVTHLLFNAAEARRITAMTHRSSYFVPANPEAGRRLEAFFAHCVEPVFSDGPVEVMRLLPAPR